MGAPLLEVDKASEKEKTRNELYALLSESLTKLGENGLGSIERTLDEESQLYNYEGLFS